MALDRLRAAAAAYARADYAGCVEHLAGLDAQDLPVSDSALLLEAQCLFYNHQLPEAAARFARLVKVYPSSPHASLALLRRADCLWNLGKRVEAVEVYEQADVGPEDGRADRAVGLAHRAQAALDAGQAPRADRLWLELRRRFANHPLATPALAGREEPPLVPSQALELAAALHAARRWDEALAVLDAVPDPVEASLRYQLAFRTGRALFDIRGRYAEAAALLLAARDHAPTPATAEAAWFWGSRALSRADHDREAVASHLLMVERHPGGEHAAQALFYAGWLEQNHDRCTEALPHFDALLTRYPRSRWALEGRWFGAWCHLKTGQYSRAIEILKPMLGHADWRVGGQALYWTGLAQQEQGQAPAAEATWQRLLDRHPLCWYALLGRARLGERAPPPPSPPPPASERKAITDPLLEHAHMLVAGGLAGFASQRLRLGEEQFLARHPGRSGRLALMDAYRLAGDAHRPWALASRAESVLGRLPTAETRALWDHAYPPCERERLARLARGIPERVLLLQAIMRTESGFDPLARSVADARGLLQLIPPVGQRAAAGLGLADFDPVDLFDPETNLRLASWTVAELAAAFGGHAALIAAAYNGGQDAVQDWCRRRGGWSLDRFVEAIPYAETRGYVKAVLTAQARYAQLEGQPLPVLSLELSGCTDEPR